MKKNQLVLTVLAIIVVVAGYITLSGNGDTNPKNPDSALSGTEASTEGNLILGNKDLLNQVSEDDLLAENNAIKDSMNSDSNQPSTDNTRPGEAILTSGVTVSNYIAQTKLKREQSRGSNKSTLLQIIENDTVDQAQKQAAIESMVTLTSISEKENAAETMLSTQGFDDAIVSISGGKVDVVVCRNSLSLAEKAQIEDIVKRKTEVGIENIVISLMEIQEQKADTQPQETENNE